MNATRATTASLAAVAMCLLGLAACGTDTRSTSATEVTSPVQATDAVPETDGVPPTDGMSTTDGMPTTDGVPVTATDTTADEAPATSSTGAQDATGATEQTVPTSPLATTPVDAARHPVVQYTIQEMFPVTPPFLRNGPQTVIYDDGTMLVSFRGNFASQPQVWPYEVGHLEPAAVADLLASAEERGLLVDPEPYVPNLQVADAPRTTLVLDTPDGVFTHVIDGLLGDETDPRRLAVQGFIGEIASLAMDVQPASSFYEPTQLAIVAVPAEANARVTKPWPDPSVDLAEATECTVVADPAAVRLLNDSLAGARYEQDGVAYVVTSRILPDGTTC